jgi:hypothetical protein
MLVCGDQDMKNEVTPVLAKLVPGPFVPVFMKL